MKPLAPASAGRAADPRSATSAFRRTTSMPGCRPRSARSSASATLMVFIRPPGLPTNASAGGHRPESVARVGYPVLAALPRL